MDYRTLLIAVLGLATSSLAPSACRADDPVPPDLAPPAHTPEQYARCGMLRAMPDWCRDRPVEPRVRVRVRPNQERTR